jgi:hypothetical protein
MDLEAALRSVLDEQLHRVVAGHEHLVARALDARGKVIVERNFGPTADQLHLAQLFEPGLADRIEEVVAFQGAAAKSDRRMDDAGAGAPTDDLRIANFAFAAGDGADQEPINPR